MRKEKVIIVGAGVAGLGAAKRLNDNGFTDFIVLEAQGKIGGRMDAQPFGSSIVELGAAWLHRDDSNLFHLVKESDCLHEKVSWEGEGEFVTSSGEKVEIQKVQKFLGWFDKQLDDIDDYVEKVGRASARESLGSYFDKNFQKYLQQDKIDHRTPDSEKLSDELKQAIFQWCNSFQRIDNSCHKTTDVSLIRWPQFEKNFPSLAWLYHNFKEGTQKTVEKIAQNFLHPDKNLKLNTPVTQINWESGQPEIVVTCGDNQQFKCDTLIVTCSLGVLKAEKSRLFVPPLAENVSKAIDSSGFGPLGKIYLEWDTPWWPQDCRGYQFLWPNDYIDCCKGGSKGQDEDELAKNWVKSITGFDPILNNPNVLLAWLGGPEAIFVETLDDNTIKRKCAEILAKFTGLEVPLPKSALVSKWNANPYVRGAYSYCSVKSDDMDQVGDPWDTLACPILQQDELGLLKPSIIFAGEGISKEYYSTLHGAYASGEEQATKLLTLYKNWRRARAEILKTE